MEAHTVRKIVSSDGKVLYESPQSSESAVSAETASILTDMLRTAASEGSANALSAVGANVAGKTGTVDMESGGQPRRLDGGLHAATGRRRVDGL